MKIPTTITVLREGVCIIECDVVCNIGYKFDRRYSELEWWVDEYTIEGNHSIWTKEGTSTESRDVVVVVPEKLAEVFDEYLDRDSMDEKVRDTLADWGDDRGDFLRDMAMDR